MKRFKQLVRSIARRVGLSEQNADHLAYMRRQELHRAFINQYGRQVVAGPFEGIVLTGEAAWSGGDQLLQTLGTYEKEVLEIIGQLQRSLHPDLICNIGCADGYYALGLAKIFPDARVLAFDIDTAAQLVARRSAAENGLAEKIEVGGRCDERILDDVMRDATCSLLVIDCEGYEVELFSKGCNCLRNAWLIIECHDFIIPNATKTVTKSLLDSHFVSVIEETRVEYSRHEFCQKLSSFDRLLTVCEFRPEPMKWLFCRPRTAM